MIDYEQSHRSAMLKAEEYGKDREDLTAANVFAFRMDITWLFYNPIRDEWNGSDGEIYSTSAIWSAVGIWGGVTV